MPNIRKPRSGSMQYWPRKRAKRVFARVRYWAKSAEAKFLGFAGYKAGMTHLMITDNRKTSLTKGEDIFCPVTVIECPQIKIASIRFYKNTINGLKIVSEVFSDALDKELERRLVQKKSKKKVDEIKDFDDLRVMAYTQPKLTGIGKKKPELFEIAIGGKKEDKLKYAKEILGKELKLGDVIKEGQQLDFHTITKGKGFQGPVKRYGIGLTSHKSEKTRRGPGAQGGWIAQGHWMYRIAFAGRMGYNQRTEYNKQVLKIGSKGEEINPKGGFLHYGVIKNPYIIVKGSIGGPVKRIVRFNFAIRANKKIPKESPAIQYISRESKQ